MCLLNSHRTPIVICGDQSESECALSARYDAFFLQASRLAEVLIAVAGLSIGCMHKANPLPGGVQQLVMTLCGDHDP